MSIGWRLGRGPRWAAAGGVARTSTRPISMVTGEGSASASFTAAANARSVASCFIPAGSTCAAAVRAGRSCAREPAPADGGEATAAAGAAVGAAPDAAGLRVTAPVFAPACDAGSAALAGFGAIGDAGIAALAADLTEGVGDVLTCPGAAIDAGDVALAVIEAARDPGEATPADATPRDAGDAAAPSGRRATGDRDPAAVRAGVADTGDVDDVSPGNATVRDAGAAAALAVFGATVALDAATGALGDDAAVPAAFESARDADAAVALAGFAATANNGSAGDRDTAGALAADGATDVLAAPRAPARAPAEWAAGLAPGWAAGTRAAADLSPAAKAPFDGAPAMDAVGAAGDGNPAAACGRLAPPAALAAGVTALGEMRMCGRCTARSAAGRCAAADALSFACAGEVRRGSPGLATRARPSATGPCAWALSGRVADAA